MLRKPWRIESSLPRRPAGTPETDQRTDDEDSPGLRGNTSLVRCAEGEKDDDPLPQSDGTPNCRSIADNQDEGVPVCKNGPKLQQRLRLSGLAGVLRPRHCSPGNQDAGGAENAGEDKSVAPAQEHSNPAEQKRQ